MSNKKMSDEAKKYFDEGLQYSNSGCYIEAIDCYDKAISLDKKSSLPWLAKGNALCGLKRYKKSLEAIDQSISLDKKNFLAWQSKGLTLHIMGSFEESIKAYDEAISLDKTNGFSWKRKGDALKKLGRNEEAISAYDIAISLEPNYASPLSRKGLILLSLGRYKEAIDAYDAAIELDPKHVYSWIGKGDANIELNLFKEAELCFDTAISLNPELYRAWHGKGVVLTEKGCYEKAINCFDKAIFIDSKLFYSWYSKGIALTKLYLYEEALACFDNAISLGPGKAECWHGKGEMLNNLGRYEEALIAYDKTVFLDPSIPSHWNGKGNSLCSMGRNKEAIICFDEAIAIDPTFYAALNGKAIALTNLNQYKDALDIYNEAISYNPKIAILWHGKANALTGLERYDVAFSANDKAIMLDPKLPYPWFGKGQLYNELGEMQQAQACLIRGYYHSNQYNLAQSLESVSKLITKYFSDLFIYRASRDHPFLMTSVNWALIAASALGRSIDLLKFIRYIKKYKGFDNEVERKKFLGITYFYLGDPLEAHKIFDEVDSLDDNDLMGQYYLVASMNAYEEPADNELDFALKKAQQILGSRDDVAPEQLFYAGLLLCLNKEFKSAIVAFRSILQNDKNNLAAQYMLMLSFHRQKNIEERNKLIQMVLKKERLLHAEGKQGFIGGVFPKSFDLVSTRWDRPFRKYARWVEISEAIVLIHELVERHELRYGELPRKVRFLDEAKEEPEGLLQGWVQNEKFVAEIERAKADMDRDDIEVMSCELKKSFHPSFFAAQPETKIDFEFEIGQLIKEQKKPAKKNMQRYHDLIAYCYFQNKISGRSYALLTYYLFYQLYRYKQKKRNRYVEEAIKATLFETLSYLFLSVTGQGLTKPVTPAVYAGFSYSYDKIKELVLDKEGVENMSYAEFKTQLNNFFVELAEKKRDLPESVKSLWMSAD